MKTSARQLVRGLEMEMEKLKGSERSVCAGITARFITARDGQIRHKTAGGKARYLDSPGAARGSFTGALMSAFGSKKRA